MPTCTAATPALVPDHGSEIIHAATITAWILAIFLWVVRGWFGKMVFEKTAFECCNGWSLTRIAFLTCIAVSELFVFGFAISLIVGTMIQFGFINYILESTGCSASIEGFTEYNFAFYSYAIAGIVVFALFYTSPLRIFKKKFNDTAAYEAVRAGDDLGSAAPNEKIADNDAGFWEMFVSVCKMAIGIATGKYDNMEENVTAFPARLYTYITGVLYVFTISAATSEFRRRFWTAFLAGGFGFTIAVAFVVAIIMHVVARRARAVNAASLHRDIAISMLCMAIVYLGIFIWDNEPNGQGNDDGTWWTRACGSDYMSYGQRTGFALLVPIGPVITAGIEWIGHKILKK